MRPSWLEFRPRGATFVKNKYTINGLHRHFGLSFVYNLIVPALPMAPGFQDCEWVRPAQPALQSDDKLVAAVNGPLRGPLSFLDYSLTAPKAIPFGAWN